MNIEEKKVQELITDFPWLLNINYERIPELQNKGMEYNISESKRIDLLLRDKLSGRPVLIEFKAVPYYRENIGQILEYRARVIPELTNEDSELLNVFGSVLVSPIMILVVPSCSQEARLACNLSGIEVYEYEKDIKGLLIPEKRMALEDMAKAIDNSILPLTKDRDQFVIRIEKEIEELLNEMGFQDSYSRFRHSPDTYDWGLERLFINKWIFPERIISVGIFEDMKSHIFKDITFEFYSNNKEALAKFREKYIQLDKGNSLKHPEITKEDNKTEFYLTYFIDKNEFVENTKKVLKPLFEKYSKIIRAFKTKFE